MPKPSVDTAATYPAFADQIPFDTLQEGRYEVRFARTESELDAVLRLRFEVFNLELNEGLEESFATGRDRDAFDDTCHHLMIVEQQSGEVVGTYRMQTSRMAAEGGLGFYSAGEFDLSKLPPEVVGDAVEVGRACVALGHRNTQVLFLLWRGLAAYMTNNHRRFLFGCCSLTSQDREEGRAVMQHLETHGHLHPEIRIAPLPGFECYDEMASGEGADGEAADRETADHQRPTRQVRIPKLFRTYLRHGAKVCGPPAIDRQFKTIDYLVIFDVAAMEERRFRMFFG